MRNVINLALLTALALSSSSIGVFAHDGEDDDHHPVTNQLPGTYPVAPGASGQQPGYLGQPVYLGPGHINDPRFNPGHSNSLRHQAKDALNSAGQGGAPGYAGYGAPGVAQPYGYLNQAGYSGQTGPGHINDPNYNPGHNNSLGHQLKDAINPGVAPAYGAPGAVPVYGYDRYQGAPVGANHVNNPYINPGHNGSVQHQLNDAVNAGQVLPGQVPRMNRRDHGHGHGLDEHGHNH